LAENPATLSVCLQAHENMVQHTGDLPHTVTCPLGLSETAVPVTLGEQTIGYLRIGEVLRHVPAKSDVTKVSRELKRNGVRFTAELRKSWERTPLMLPGKYNAVVRLLTFFAEQLSALSNQINVGETECGAASGAEGTGIHRPAQDGTALVIDNGESCWCQRLSLLQGIPQTSTLPCCSLTESLE